MLRVQEQTVSPGKGCQWENFHINSQAFKIAVRPTTATYNSLHCGSSHCKRPILTITQLWCTPCFCHHEKTKGAYVPFWSHIWLQHAQTWTRLPVPQSSINITNRALGLFHGHSGWLSSFAWFAGFRTPWRQFAGLWFIGFDVPKQLRLQGML